LACSGPKPQIPEKSQSGSPDASNVKVNGDISDPLVFRGEGDVEREQYWGKEFPNLYEKDFEPISGGYFAVTADSEAPPCTTAPQEVAGNAFYCSTEDVVAWDAQELVHFTG
jgi:hypothetical protein